MTIDADQYRVNVLVIKQLLIDKTDVERLESISALAIITGVPIVIVMVYIIEIYGEIPGITEKLYRLMKFYHIDKIENTEVKICV
jgi:hypothetical protein